MAKATKKKTKKAVKKKKRTVVSGQIHVHATFNNTIITVSDTKGNSLLQSSAGAQGFKGSRKSTAYAAQIASDAVIGEAVERFGLKKVDVFVKGIGQGRDSAVRALGNHDVQVMSIKDETPVPHNGCRARKPRRA